MIYELRDYQIQAKQEIYAAWESGAQNIMVQMSTGAGKTVLFCSILSEEPGESIAIAHRMELVNQISLTLAQHGIRHGVIGAKTLIPDIVNRHMLELGTSYYDANAKCKVASVDTLVRLPAHTPWLKRIKLVVMDEGHHVLRKNKWGKAASMFPNARGLYPTATPKRADGNGLGRSADGIMDRMILGPPMRQLIHTGYLTDYKIVAPKSDINLAQVPIADSGDYSLPKLRDAVHKSRITGDIVENYLKFAAGKIGLTFAVDIESATEIAAQYRSQGVAAEVISSKTPPLLRSKLMRQLRSGDIKQLVNVDILGEGTDVPVIEVVSFGRPSQSFVVLCQQLGRVLRPSSRKTFAMVIDHVGNCMRLGVPDDVRRIWTLDRQEKRARNAGTEIIIGLKNCLNLNCLAVYERTKRVCPYCGHYAEPSSRRAPEFVDGDLTELDAQVLAALRGEITRVDAPPRIPQHLSPRAQIAVSNRHYARQQKQIELRKMIALWAGYQRILNREDDEIYKHFYFDFGIDVASAQSLNVKDAEALNDKINIALRKLGVVEDEKIRS
jgi:DNA repair protein RadD